MSANRCPIDHRLLITSDRICEVCSAATRKKLAEIPALYLEASAYLEPGRGGSGSSGSERTIGVNLAALGFRQAFDVLAILEDWERTVRVKSLGQIELDGQDREGEVELNPDGSIKVVVRASDPVERPIVRRGSIEERVQGVCEFLLVHAKWLAKYEGAEHWANDIAGIHNQGNAATRRFTEKVTQIRCPGSVEVLAGENTDEIKTVMCGKTLTLKESPLDPIKCKRCAREWTTLRLIKVAIDTPGYVFLLDSASIALLLGVTPRHVTRIIKEFKVRPHGKRGEQVYDLMEINSLRAKMEEK